MLEELGGPHLVLTNLSDNEETRRKHLLQGFEHLFGAGAFTVHPDGIALLVLSNLLHPLLVHHRLGDTLVQLLEHHLQITHHMAVGLDVLVNLSRIHIDVDDPCILGKGAGLAHHAITETSSDDHQQVTGGDTHVGNLGSVHTNQAGKAW
ncbi:hypothetical protein SDC9_163393 [bioreactor metagenome]|uniref:Uncharacterized protein n=1 Tax=bioreactor metagenome TaxID=1076179 RepID=A0A645FNQ4_9ZZZZ